MWFGVDFIGRGSGSPSSDAIKHHGELAMMTKDQVRWAQSHDWFVTDNGDGSVVVEDYAMCDDAAVLVDCGYAVRPHDSGVGFAGSACRVFDSYVVLRAWAGY